MTQARHRAPAPSAPARPDGPGLRGGAPIGMWWVAWRQQRMQIAVLLAMVAAACAALAILRSRIVSTFAAFGCERFPDDPYGEGCRDPQGVDVWWNYGFADFSGLAHTALLAAPIVLGVFAAAPIFTREFGRGTHVVALTQSVGRLRWFAAKTTVAALPLVAGLLVLGATTSWLDGAVGISSYGALDQRNFFVRGLVPAAMGLMVFGATIAIGMITRNVIATLVAGLVIGGALAVGIALAQPYLLPADRTSVPIAEQYPTVTQADIDAEINGTPVPTDSDVRIDRNKTYVGSGYLDADGAVVEVGPGALTPCYNASSQAGEEAIANWTPDRSGGADESEGSGGADADGSGGSDDAAAEPPAGSGVVSAAPVDDSPYNSAEYRNASNEAMRTCLADMGIAAQYSDVLPGSLLWPLRWMVAGILVALAAVFLGVGAWRLRPAVAKR